MRWKELSRAAACWCLILPDATVSPAPHGWEAGASVQRSPCECAEKAGCCSGGSNSVSSRGSLAVPGLRLPGLVPGPAEAGLQQDGVWVSPAFDVQHFRDSSEKPIPFPASLPSASLPQGSLRLMSSVLWQEAAAGGRAVEHPESEALGPPPWGPSDAPGFIFYIFHTLLQCIALNSIRSVRCWLHILGRQSNPSGPEIQGYPEAQGLESTNKSKLGEGSKLGVCGFII